MKFTVSKSWTFQAAHSNPYHAGPCRNVHGHSYEVRVWARRDDDWIEEDGPHTGMVVDTGHLSAVWAELFARIDHSLLNESTPCDPTTIENLAAWLLMEFYERGAPEVFRVRVSEGATAYAEVER